MKRNFHLGMESGAWLVLLYFAVWLRKVGLLSQPIRWPNRDDLVTCVFPPFKQVACFYSELLLAPCDNSLAMIGCCVYISFGLTPLNRTLRQWVDPFWLKNETVSQLNPAVLTLSKEKFIRIFFALLPSESCMSKVSLLFLYGINCCSLDKAEITSPRALKLLLIDWASCGIHIKLD